MDDIAKKKLIFATLIILIACAIIVLTFFAPVQRTSGVAIASDLEISQGQAEKNTEMESVKVHGTFWNNGDVIANNLTATVIFADDAHNKVIKKTVKEGVDLLQNREMVVEFETEYLREKTIPKTVVNTTLHFNWTENGILKNSSTKEK